MPSDPHDWPPPTPPPIPERGPPPSPPGHAVPPPGVATARPVEFFAARPLSNPLELRNLSWREALLDGFLILTVTVLAHYLPNAIAAPFLGGAPLEGAPGWLIAVMKGTELFVAVVVAWYIVHRSSVAAQSFGWRTDGILMQLLWVPAVLIGVYAYMFATAIAIAPWMMQEGAAEEEFRERMEFINVLPSDNPLLLALIFGFVGLHEELVFRGLLLTYARRLLGSWWAAILAVSVLFGLLHVPGQGLLAAAQITGVGVVLSVFFILSRSLIALAVAHALFNFAQTQLARQLIELLGPEPEAALGPAIELHTGAALHALALLTAA